MGRVPPKGAGEVRCYFSFFPYFAANSYCGNTSSVFFIALWGDEKSTFPRGEGFLCVNPQFVYVMPLVQREKML